MTQYNTVVSEAEAEAAKKWMNTPEYRDRVEQLRQRSRDGEVMSIEGMAEFLNIPVPYVAAVAAKHWNQPGGFVPINDGGPPN